MPSISAASGTPTGNFSYELRAVGLLAAGFGLVGLDRWLIMPLAPQIMHDLRLDYQDLGNLGAAIGLSWGVFAIIMGRLSDRIGRRKIIIPAVIAFSLLSGISGLATGFAGLFIARLLMGVAEGAYCPTSYAAALDASPASRRGINLGIIQGAFALGGLALGPIIATQLAAILPSWRDVFMLVSIPGLILAFMLWRVLRDPVNPGQSAHHESASANWLALFAYRNICVAIPAIFCSMSGIFVLGVMAPVYLTDVVKLDSVTMGFVMSGFGLGGFLGQILLGILSDRIGRKPSLFIAFIVGAAALAALVLWVQSPTAIFAALFMAAFCCCGANALLAGPISGECVPSTMASSAMGLVIGLGEIFGGGVAPSIGGAIAMAGGLKMTLLTVDVVLVAGAAATLFLKETAPQIVARR
ncbi:MFS transporter [Novosphingobium sp. SG707]|uniref:MFS transporter n=1 Tax=Novosphingobium sp. SG707 TaxID=2586996 RepID=UPI00144631BF|nr:MFS transporter [Novosphingobium sp. SG707]NKJ01649.1 putative MFS family arabinose efflux permease [Novosphingobium sp. SG707]